MKTDASFAENVLKAFKNIHREIEKGSSEHDVRYRFVKYFVEEVLGYEPKYIKWEKKRADLTILDENGFSVIKIETKKPSENIDKLQHEEQAFKYEEEATRFVGLTNFLQFKLWEVRKTTVELRMNLDFSRILNQGESINILTGEKKSQLLFLINLTKESLFDPSKYNEYDENYARIDITKDAGFRKLIDQLNFIANNVLLGYTLKTFGEYREGYNRYVAERSEAERELKNNKGNYELNYNIVKYRQKLEEKYKKYITFGGYGLWKEYSGKEDIPDDEIKEVFCKETIYVLLNKLIFIRICEDKAFLEKNISNGGIEQLREFLKKRFDTEIINKEILEMAFKSASGLYSHFYEVGILDWFRTGDGQLNELLNRVLWILNQFDFTHVDRDILGNLYEKYLSSEERKRLGEFYTPTDIIDYILTSVGYTYSHDIETKDLLDPACGSGGFLVRASRQLMSSYLMKFGKTDKKELKDPRNWKEIVNRLSPEEAKIILESIHEHIYGLDINPFACHITEMNLLFQIIDLYQKIREKHKDYKLKRFKIYRTDSLEKSTQKKIFDYTHPSFLEEQEEINSIKNKKFDFVVGNPPWGGILKRGKGTMLAKRLKRDYVSAVGKYDIYVLFMERGINWLKTGGKFGYIVQNRFLRVDYAKKLREYLLENVRIEKIVDFGDTKVFTDATNYPAIIILEKKRVTDNELIYIEVKPKANELLPGEIMNYVKSYSPGSEDYLSIAHLNQEELRTLDVWVPSQIFIRSVLKRIKNVQYLRDVTEEILEGVTPGGKGADSIYVISKNVIETYRIEPEISKKVLKGEDIRRWNLEWNQRFLFYPYDSEGKEVDIEEYPNAFEYIKQSKDILSKRILDGKIITEWGDKQWFSFWRIRNPEVFPKQKIVSPRIAASSRFALDEKGEFYLTDSAVAIVPKEIEMKYLLGILNSNLLFYIIKNTSPFVQGGYYSYTRTYLEDLPIKLPEGPDEKKVADLIIERVNNIIELHESGILEESVLGGEETEKLCNLPKVSFSMKENAKFEEVGIDRNRIYLNSDDFVEIRNKEIFDFVKVYLEVNSEKLIKSEDFKDIILNLPVPKSDKILKEFLKKGTVNHSKIKEEITKVEQEINDLVYKIYEITEKEKEIIEKNL